MYCLVQDRVINITLELAPYYRSLSLSIKSLNGAKILCYFELVATTGYTTTYYYNAHTYHPSCSLSSYQQAVPSEMLGLLAEGLARSRTC